MSETDREVAGAGDGAGGRSSQSVLFEIYIAELDRLRRIAAGMGLGVADAEKAYQELQDAGMDTLEDAPVTLPFWDKGVKYFNIRGPDGEKVEFNEKIK